MLQGQDIVKHGYTDYSSPGNILKTKDGNYYVVDTEWKSFADGSPQSLIFGTLTNEDTFKGSPDIFCLYFKERFQLINGLEGSEKIIEFSVLK